MHYVEHLSKDQKLKELIGQHGVFKLEKKKNLYLYLCYSIMSQQLSVKVARVIQNGVFWICMAVKNQHRNRSSIQLLKSCGLLVLAMPK